MTTIRAGTATTAMAMMFITITASATAERHRACRQMEESDRDKTGTTTVDSPATYSKDEVRAALVANGSESTERAGFEPAVGFDPHAALAKRCFRPLSHLSDLLVFRCFLAFQQIPTFSLGRPDAAKPGPTQ